MDKFQKNMLSEKKLDTNPLWVHLHEIQKQN